MGSTGGGLLSESVACKPLVPPVALCCRTGARRLRDKEHRAMKILVIEDNTGIGKLVRQGLENAKFHVDWAQDGARGLILAEEHRYSVIVLDLMLPKVDGWQVCKELRARRNRTPVLMLTARDAVEDRVRGLDLGADDYLPKPFDFA